MNLLGTSVGFSTLDCYIPKGCSPPQRSAARTHPPARGRLSRRQPGPGVGHPWGLRPNRTTQRPRIYHRPCTDLLLQAPTIFMGAGLSLRTPAVGSKSERSGVRGFSGTTTKASCGRAPRQGRCCRGPYGIFPVPMYVTTPTRRTVAGGKVPPRTAAPGRRRVHAFEGSEVQLRQLSHEFQGGRPFPISAEVAQCQARLARRCGARSLTCMSQPEAASRSAAPRGLARRPARQPRRPQDPRSCRAPTACRSGPGRPRPS